MFRRAITSMQINYKTYIYHYLRNYNKFVNRGNKFILIQGLSINISHNNNQYKISPLPDTAKDEKKL